MNKVILIGRTTKEIELRMTPSGKNYAEFTIACDNGKDENGEKRKSDFVNCVAWGNRAETISKYVKKGNRFAVIGTFKTDQYQGDDGKTKYRSYCLVNEYEFIEGKKDDFVPSEPDDYITKTSEINSGVNQIPEENQEIDGFSSFASEADLSGLDNNEVIVNPMDLPF